METKWKPTKYAFAIVTEGGELICNVCPKGLTQDEHLSLALLLATTPDLYKALKAQEEANALWSCLSEKISRARCDEDVRAIVSEWQRSEETAKELRAAAIAKAEGRE